MLRITRRTHQPRILSPSVATISPACGACAGRSTVPGIQARLGFWFVRLIGPGRARRPARTGCFMICAGPLAGCGPAVAISVGSKTGNGLEHLREVALALVTDHQSDLAYGMLALGQEH